MTRPRTAAALPLRAWVTALADGSVVVIGDYLFEVTLGQGQPNETTLHGVCDNCTHGAFLERYAW